MSLEVKKIKNSKNWYIRGTVRGVAVYKSSGTTNRDVADRERRKIEERILYGNTVTFGDIAKKYLKNGGSPKWLLDQYDEDADEFTGVLGQFEGVYLSEINQEKLDTAARKAFPHVKPQTLNRQFYTPFIAVWNYGVKLEKCELRAWSRPRVKSSDLKKTQWFRYKQAETFFWNLTPHLQAIFVFCIYTGARITEAVETDIGDIDIGARWGVLNATKTDNQRGVPLHRAVVGALKRAIGGRKEGRVFLTQNEKPYKSKRTASGHTKGGGYFKTAWKSGLTKSGLQGFTPYSMRHSLNNWMILEGIDDTRREAIMGHDNQSTNSIYSDVPQGELIETIDKIPDFTDFSRL